MNIIEISGLKKSFKNIKAVDDISFRVKEGELFAFLGLNGAGKSTTISIICGRLSKDAGTVTVDSHSVDNDLDIIKSEIGVVFQSSVLDKVLSVEDNLKSRAALYGITGEEYKKRLEELCEMLDLTELLKRPVGKLSGGQRRRVDVARALFHRPKILILDEPTTGLDPQSRIMVWSVIEKLRKTSGLTVFLTTHYMEEAAEADYVVIIEKGKVVANGTPNELKEQYTGDFIKLYSVDEEKSKENEQNFKAKGIEYTKENGYLKIAVESTSEVRKLIIENEDLFSDFEVIKGRMDDVFLAATGNKPKEDEE